MKKNKKTTKVNWYFVLLGIIALYLGVFRNSSLKNKYSFKEIDVELSSDIITIKGSRTHRSYKFWTKEYISEFILLRGSISRGNSSGISGLISGQKIRLAIRESDLVNLNSKKKEVFVYGLYLDGEPLLTTKEFQINRRKYKMRKSVLAVFMSFMFILNGLFSVSNKINYLLVSIFLLAFIFMRVLAFGLY